MIAPRNTAPGTQLDVAASTDVGQEREVNQDRVAEGQVAGGHLLVVADGMGGHAAGEEAARIVVESLFEIFKQRPDEAPTDNLYVGMQRAHDEVLEYAERHDTQGMGSTAVAAFLKGGETFIAHVGDSRLYWLRDGRVHWRTKDHTRVAKMVEIGVLTEEQAKEHPDANVITRAIGHLPAEGPREFEADVQAAPAQVVTGDTLLLCSDGLFDLVEDGEIIDFIAGRPAQTGIDSLIALANERGGHDNISVIVAHFGLGTTPRPDAVPGAPESASRESWASIVAEDRAPEAAPPATPASPTEPNPELSEDSLPPTTSALPTSASAEEGIGKAADARAVVRRQRQIIALLTFLVLALVGAIAWLATRGPVAPTAGEPTSTERGPGGADDDPGLPEGDDDDSGDDSAQPDDDSAPPDDDSPSPQDHSTEPSDDPPATDDESRYAPDPGNDGPWVEPEDSAPGDRSP